VSRLVHIAESMLAHKQAEDVGMGKLSCDEAPLEHLARSQSAAERDLLEFASEVVSMAEQQCREEGSGALTPCVYLQGPHTTFCPNY